MSSQRDSILLALLLLGFGCGDTKQEDSGSGEGASVSPWTDVDDGMDADDADDGGIVDSDADSDGTVDTGTDDSPAPVETGSPDTGDTASSGPIGTDDDGDGVSVEAGDCDDADPDRYPGNTELCDGIDNDCDGEVDGPDPADGTFWYADFDRDSWGDDDVFVISCERPVGHSSFKGDCDDVDDSIYPGAFEVCDGKDNDCDGLIDIDTIEGETYYADVDEDGFGDPEAPLTACSMPDGYVEDDSDCLDSDDSVNPDGIELCNGLDDDCSGSIDDGFDLMMWYRDDDGDGRGDPASTVLACAPPAGHVTGNLDCDDTDALIHGEMAELCDEKDNDCDGVTDEDLVDITFYRDLDGDGYGTESDTTAACRPPDGYVFEAGDCADDNDEIRPGRTEACNGIDDNCDVIIDEGWPLSNFYRDADEDGHGAGSPEAACAAPVGHVALGDDCNDEDAMVSPSALADCEDEVDEDCDGEVDEGPYDTVFYQDADGDGFGNAEVTSEGCWPEPGWVWNSTDCDDSSGTAYPGHREDCRDIADNDCDGLPDDVDPDCDCPDHGYVEDADLGTSTGDAVASGSTVGEDETYSGDCGMSGALDRFYRFAAPEDGCYTFDTEGSTYDTLLRVFDACEGISLSCDDDGGPDRTSKIEQALEAGDEVFVVVDGYTSGSTGDYTLNIDYEPAVAAGEPVSYPVDEELGDTVGSEISTGSTVGAGDDFDGRCGSSGGEDVAFSWVAPERGCWEINTAGSTFDTVLRVYSSEAAPIACGSDDSSELHCDDDGGSGLTSSVTMTVSAGDEFVIVVDGFSTTSGDYVLSIEECGS